MFCFFSVVKNCFSKFGCTAPLEKKNGQKNKTQIKKARILEKKSISIEADDGNKILSKVFNPSFELKNNR